MGHRSTAREGTAPAPRVPSLRHALLWTSATAPRPHRALPGHGGGTSQHQGGQGQHEGTAGAGPGGAGGKEAGKEQYQRATEALAAVWQLLLSCVSPSPALLLSRPAFPGLCQVAAGQLSLPWHPPWYTAGASLCSRRWLVGHWMRMGCMEMQDASFHIPAIVPLHLMYSMCACVCGCDTVWLCDCARLASGCLGSREPRQGQPPSSWRIPWRGSRLALPGSPLPAHDQPRHRMPRPRWHLPAEMLASVQQACAPLGAAIFKVGAPH